jgi:hypothetical protein
MKKIFTILLILCFNICLAQNKIISGDIRYRVSYAITKNIDIGLLSKTPKNFAYLFSVALSFNKNGKIDTAYFSKNIDLTLSKVMGLNSSLVSKIKSMNLEYTNYSSKVVIIPFLWYNQSDYCIDYHTGFLKQFENIFPHLNNEHANKSYIVLDPMINPFTLPIR